MRERLPRRLSVHAQLIQISFIYYIHYTQQRTNCTARNAALAHRIGPPHLVFPSIGINQPCVPLQHSLGDGESYEFHQAPFISTQGAGNRGRKRGSRRCANLPLFWSAWTITWARHCDLQVELKSNSFLAGTTSLLFILIRAIQLSSQSACIVHLVGRL